MDKKIELNERELEIVSVLSKALKLGSKKTVRERILAILSTAKRKHWTKYEFHNYNIAARSFIRICRRLNLRDVPVGLATLFKKSEIILFYD
jgi:hypothetical protein